MKRAFKLRKKSVSAPYKRISPNQHPETLEKPSLPLNVDALTPNNIVQLQGVIGNQAVQRLLAAHAPVKVHQHTSPTVQRKPDGLESQNSINVYTDHAAKLWKTNPKMSLRDFTFSMMNLIAGELDSHGVPIPGWTLKTGLGYDGKFEQDSWHMFIDPSAFTDTPGASVLQDLSKDEVTKVVGTFYHEARHADQDFLVARMLAGKGKMPAEIKAATKIPIAVGEEAVHQKLTKTNANSDQIANAEVLFDTMYGEHKELLAFIIDFAGTIQEVKNETLTVDSASLSDVAAKTDDLVKKLENWSTTILKKKLQDLSKKKTKNALDQQMLDLLTKIDQKLDIGLKAWAKISKSSVSAVKGFGKQLGDLFTVVFDAYHKLESEADAFRVEEKVQKEFKRKS